MRWFLIISFTFLINSIHCEFLRVSGRDFYYGDKKVFLSGPNIAWNSYGHDFGNGHYESSGPVLEQWIREISQAGGNTLRIWIHVEGVLTPNFDQDGFVTGPDSQGTFLQDLSDFLDYAKLYNILVIPCLWNGAFMGNDNYINLVWDDSKLQSYINNALIPMVQRLKDKPALGAWEIINEFEGSIKIESHSNPCFDTSKMGSYGAGWTGKAIPIQLFLRFINWQTAAIKATDPKVLVTSGSWSEHSQSDAYFDTYDYYKDTCLYQAGGLTLGTIDFYQMHSYSWEGKWNTHSPFKVTGDSFNLNKPLVIGEFSSDCSEGEDIVQLFDWGYNKNYSGIWTWQYNAGGHCSDSKETQNEGMNSIKSYTHNGHVQIILE